MLYIVIICIGIIVAGLIIASSFGFLEEEENF